MKKIFGGMCAVALAFGLAGCGKDDEPETISFAEYLESSEGYTVSDLNTAVGPVSIGRDNYLTALDITDTKMEVELEGDMAAYNGTYYMWSDVEGEGEDAINYLYGARPDSQETSGYSVGKINLDQIDELIEGATAGITENEMVSLILTDTDESGTVEASEVIDNLITMYGADTETINIESILSKIDFDINDFEDKGNGVYKLKMSAIVDLFEEITGQEMPEGSESQLEAIEDIFGIELTYAENHIQEVRINLIAQEEDVVVGNTLIKFAMTYVDNEVSKTTISVITNVVDSTTSLSNDLSGGEIVDGGANPMVPSFDFAYSSIEITLGEKEFGLAVKAGESPLNITTGFSYSSTTQDLTTTIDVELKQEGETVLDLSASVIGSWLSELNMEATGLGSVEIVSNTNVTIPTNVLQAENYDITDMLIEFVSSMIAGQE